MLKKIVLALIILAAGFALVVATQPSDYRVARSASIPAPLPEVFAQINDFHNWKAWSPWEKKDPAAKTSIEGADQGAGSVFRWSGNRDVGEGSMTLTESVPNQRIRIRLEFVKPMPGTSDVEFAFKPDADGTGLTWSMSGENNFVGKAFCLFMDMDRMIGDDMEQGLANLKSVVARR